MWRWLAGAVLVLLLGRELLFSPELEGAQVPVTAKSEKPSRERSIANRVRPRLDTNEIHAKLHRVRTALYQYNAMTEEIPQGFDEVIDAGYLMVADVTDPWGRRFAFRKEKKTSNGFYEEYVLFVYSHGPDGIADNFDDVYLP